MIFRTTKLGELATMKYGKMPPRDLLCEDGFPIFSGYRVTGSCKEYLYSEPQLVVVARGVGGTGDVKISPPKSWITNLSIVLDLDESKVCKNYLLYKLGLEPLKDKLNTGAAQAQITIESLKSYSISIPDIKTQKDVVRVISAYDDLIENNRRRIQLLEQSARLLYKEWFVRLRFPGHERVKIKNGVPEGWEKVPLGDVLILQRGFDLPLSARKPGEIPIIASTGINGFHREAKVCGPGVVTGRSGSLGRVIYVHHDYWPLNTTLWVKEFKKVFPLTAYFLLSSLKLEQYNSGVAVPTLNRNDVHKIEILCPPKQAQFQFIGFALPLYEKIRLLEKQNDKLADARDLLLPRLMNGEIAV